jgi:hypothetical protein
VRKDMVCKKKKEIIINNNNNKNNNLSSGQFTCPQKCFGNGKIKGSAL